ncbi:MAG: hypothetical protein COZ56_10885, partial [Armatimonadetes bacterium CG_4_8_14_3_um_filter_58_9]
MRALPIRSTHITRALLHIALASCATEATFADSVARISASPRAGDVKVDGKLDETAWGCAITGSGLARLDTRDAA